MIGQLDQSVESRVVPMSNSRAFSQPWYRGSDWGPTSRNIQKVVCQYWDRPGYMVRVCYKLVDLVRETPIRGLSSSPHYHISNKCSFGRTRRHPAARRMLNCHVHNNEGHSSYNTDNRLVQFNGTLQAVCSFPRRRIANHFPFVFWSRLSFEHVRWVFFPDSVLCRDYLAVSPLVVCSPSYLCVEKGMFKLNAYSNFLLFVNRRSIWLMYTSQ